MNKTVLRIMSVLMAAMLMPGLGYEASAQTPQYIPTDSTATTSPQRHITPVENTDGRSPKPTLHYYDQHGNPLKEPVAVWVQEDTVRVNRVPKQPLFNGVNIGINFFDAILKIAGQSYGNYDIWASISLHNWIFPTLEAGLGYADSSPKNKNYTYHCDPSLYIKIGADYNFLYNSNPDYNVYVGFRAGFSSFSYDITNISIGSEYWGQENLFDLRSEKSNAFFGEVLAGLKVKLYRHISMGWTLRYKFHMHISDEAHSSPWFIPGYGGRNAPFSATLSLIYTI